MKRGGTVLALGLLLSGVLASTPTPLLAQDGTGTVDVSFRASDDELFAGEDLLSANGAGQSRSLIVDDSLTLLVRVENDGSRRSTVTVLGSPPADGFVLTYSRRGEDVSEAAVEGTYELVLPPGARRTIRVEVDARDAEFAAELRLVVLASTDDSADAVRAEITKVR